MSSSASRRPRVAGQRRRPARPNGSVVDPTIPTDQDESLETDSADRDAPVDADAEGQADPAAPEDPARPAELADADAADPADEDAATGTTGSRRLLVPALALALSLALLATVLLVTRHDPEQRSRDASAARATARSTLEQILSYNHETMTQQIPANQALLTGKFKDEFAATMTKTIVPLAQKDKTVVKARAYEVGVMSQTDDTVVVQAFVNQARTSDAQKEPSIDQNRVIATMRHVGNRWLVSALKAY